MINIRQLITEATTEDKLTHLEHAEDHPINAGEAGFAHAKQTLNSVHKALSGKGGKASVTTKYDGSPSIVFGRHPETGKFFVASKSAFNKNPKINYTDKDIEANHGHAPGLVSKLKSALKHLPKVTPKTGVYQGDIMHTEGDVKKEGDKAHFTPNTITYTAQGDEAKKAAKAKIGVAVHTSYSGKSFSDMKAKYNSGHTGFGEHSDVHMIDVTHPIEKTNYSKEQRAAYQQHMDQAEQHHEALKGEGYKAIAPHADTIKTYINKTVRTGEKPTVKGYKAHLAGLGEKAAEKLKTDAAKSKVLAKTNDSLAHVENHQQHFNAALQMHSSLQSAKNTLAHALSSHTTYGHSINGVATKPEGHVAVINNRPTKIVDRAEFSRANFERTRG